MGAGGGKAPHPFAQLETGCGDVAGKKVGERTYSWSLPRVKSFASAIVVLPKCEDDEGEERGNEGERVDGGRRGRAQSGRSGVESWPRG